MLLNLNYLKSNMDRFIERDFVPLPYPGADLKSNMDRFIVSDHTNNGFHQKFKIQYG